MDEKTRARCSAPLIHALSTTVNASTSQWVASVIIVWFAIVRCDCTKLPATQAIASYPQHCRQHQQNEQMQDNRVASTFPLQLDYRPDKGV